MKKIIQFASLFLVLMACQNINKESLTRVMILNVGPSYLEISPDFSNIYKKGDTVRVTNYAGYNMTYNDKYTLVSDPSLVKASQWAVLLEDPKK